jgi:hypothetical protein
MPAVLLLTVLSVNATLMPRVKMPPPNPPALLPLTLLSDTVNTPLSLLKIPPPLDGAWFR